VHANSETVSKVSNGSYVHRANQTPDHGPLGARGFWPSVHSRKDGRSLKRIYAVKCVANTAAASTRVINYSSNFLLLEYFVTFYFRLQNVLSSFSFLQSVNELLGLSDFICTLASLEIDQNIGYTCRDMCLFKALALRVPGT